MLPKNKNSAKNTIIVCLTGAILLMSVLAGIMIERFNVGHVNYKTGG